MAFSQTYWAIIVVAVLLVLASTAMAAWAALRYYGFWMLSNHPVKATARLTKKAGKKQFPLMVRLTQVPITYWIHYEFKDSRGKAYPGKSKVTRELFDTIKPDAPLDVIYHPDKPGYNCLETTLEQEKFKYLMLSLIGMIVFLFGFFLVFA